MIPHWQKPKPERDAKIFELNLKGFSQAKIAKELKALGFGRITRQRVWKILNKKI